MIMNRSLADKRKKQVTREKNLPGTQTPNSFSSHRISWEKKSESCFRHLLKVQLITSYWSGFTSKFHPSREVKKKLHLGRNLLWFSARGQFCHFWREQERVREEGHGRWSQWVKRFILAVNLMRRSKRKWEVFDFWKLKKNSKMTWWADQRGGEAACM